MQTQNPEILYLPLNEESQDKMDGKRDEGTKQDDLHDANAARERPDAGSNDENRRNGAEGDTLIPYRHNAHLRERP